MAAGVQDFNRTEFDRLNEIKGHLEIALLEKHFLREYQWGAEGQRGRCPAGAQLGHNRCHQASSGDGCGRPHMAFCVLSLHLPLLLRKAQRSCLDGYDAFTLRSKRASLGKEYDAPGNSLYFSESGAWPCLTQHVIELLEESEIFCSV